MTDVVAWLSSIELSQYASLFADNDVDLELVREMSEQDFETLGVASFGHRRKLLRAAAALSPAPIEQLAPVSAPADDALRTTAERRHLTVFACQSSTRRFQSMLGRNT